jgi:hypothetical protein
MLPKVLRGRMVITPGERDGIRGFDFRGEGNVQRLLTGWLPECPHTRWRPQPRPTQIVSPNGDATSPAKSKLPEVDGSVPNRNR